ncbi:unnamed protein product [Moneuplotes crassus]|uniref:Nucleosome assembly protein n=2 Tax=Euplotes crassus TaxID=5936 RepID=A0AAD1XS73_EUPCR|nr:unnamed protein product [Moneuplotes crassus]
MNKSQKELKCYEMKTSNTVTGIDETVRDRFKALANISNILAEISSQYEAEAKRIEFQAEQANKPLYSLRSMIVQGKDVDGTEHMIQEFDLRYEEAKNSNFEDIKVKEFNKVDEIRGQKGIPSFWLNVMKHSTMASSLILRNDENLLKDLYDIEYIPQQESGDFVLKFHFNPNSYMSNTVLTKRYIMEDDSKIKQIDSTKICWKDGMDLTEKPKPSDTSEYDYDETESFFKFFKSKEPCELNEDEGDLNSDDEAKLNTLEEDYDIAVEIKSELIPNALEYYFNIIDEIDNDKDNGSFSPDE